MCGIAGYVNLDGSPVGREELEAMADAIAHRGPDEKGVWHNGEAGFAHTRLSIIDLQKGSQPMSSADGRFYITYNGELYNYLELKKEPLRDYKFKSDSDTEVALAAYVKWGADCVKHLDGIFAFAVWDSRERAIFIARDHLGVKPVYWAQTQSRFIFASEIKSILAVEPSLKKISPKMLDLALMYRYSPSPSTLFEGIFKLRPGHSLTIEKGKVKIARFYRAAKSPAISPGEEAVSIKEKLEEAVKKQLVADVPVGVLLSGGLDSSLVASLASRFYEKKLTAFTVGYGSNYASDEIAAAGELAKHLGIRHETLTIDHNEYLSALENVVYHLEEPSATSSAVPLYYLCGKIKESHKVVLSGQGADETWGGYLRHTGENVGALVRPFMASDLLNKIASLLPRAEKIKRGFYSLGEKNDEKRFAKIFTLFNKEMRSELLRDVYQDDLSPIGYYADDIEGMEPLQKLLYLEVRLGLPDDLLLYTDKVSMAHGVEVRVPLLDRALVDQIENLPLNMKMKFLRGKLLFREIAADYLPGFVLNRKKLGFETPVDNWFIGHLAGSVRDILTGRDAVMSRLYREGAVDKMITLHQDGREDYSKQLFMLLSLEIFAKKFKVSF